MKELKAETIVAVKGVIIAYVRAFIGLGIATGIPPYLFIYTSRIFGVSDWRTGLLAWILGALFVVICDKRTPRINSMFYVANLLAFIVQSLYVRGFIANTDKIYSLAKALVLGVLSLGVGIDKPKPVTMIDKLLKYMWSIDSEISVPNLPVDEDTAPLPDKKAKSIKDMMSWIN